MAVCVLAFLFVCSFSCMYVSHSVCLLFSATEFAPSLDGRYLNDLNNIYKNNGVFHFSPGLANLVYPNKSLTWAIQV